MTTQDRMLAWFEQQTGLTTTLESPPLASVIRNVRRNFLPALFAHLGFTSGAEIGTWKAQYAVTFCDENPDLHLLCVDPWKSYKEYTDHTRHDLIAEAYEVAKTALATRKATIDRLFSVDAVHDVPNRSLDFVYIDGNHSFLNCVQDLELWSPKVKSGGIIAGHDYRNWPRQYNIHVVEAVDGFVKAHGIDPWFLLGRYKCRRSERTERDRTFLWVNS